MSSNSKIEWTDATWNPVTGCDKVSAGCKHCYAETLAKRHFGEWSKDYTRKFTDVMLHPGKLDIPFHWKKPRRIFVASVSDLFHEDVPHEFILNVFTTMLLTKQHTFQNLTKRWERMLCFLKYFATIHKGTCERIWVGVSLENQQRADAAREVMEQIASMGWNTWVSYEPALDQINWTGWEFIKQLVSGGESGHGARPSHPGWHRAARDYCGHQKSIGNNIAFFFKQWGNWAPIHELRCNENGIRGRQWFNFDPDTSVCNLGKKRTGRLLDGREWNEYPETKTKDIATS